MHTFGFSISNDSYYFIFIAGLIELLKLFLFGVVIGGSDVGADENGKEDGEAFNPGRAAVVGVCGSDFNCYRHI